MLLLSLHALLGDAAWIPIFQNSSCACRSLFSLLSRLKRVFMFGGFSLFQQIGKWWDEQMIWICFFIWFRLKSMKHHHESGVWGEGKCCVLCFSRRFQNIFLKLQTVFVEKLLCEIFSQIFCWALLQHRIKTSFEAITNSNCCKMLACFQIRNDETLMEKKIS